jgi:hypothetical protein
MDERGARVPLGDTKVPVATKSSMELRGAADKNPDAKAGTPASAASYRRAH